MYVCVFSLFAVHRCSYMYTFSLFTLFTVRLWSWGDVCSAYGTSKIHFLVRLMVSMITSADLMQCLDRTEYLQHSFPSAFGDFDDCGATRLQRFHEGGHLWSCSEKKACRISSARAIMGMCLVFNVSTLIFLRRMASMKCLALTKECGPFEAYHEERHLCKAFPRSKNAVFVAARAIVGENLLLSSFMLQAFSHQEPSLACASHTLLSLLELSVQLPWLACACLALPSFFKLSFIRSIPRCIILACIFHNFCVPGNLGSRAFMFVHFPLTFRLLYLEGRHNSILMSLIKANHIFILVTSIEAIHHPGDSLSRDEGRSSATPGHIFIECGSIDGSIEG